MFAWLDQVPLSKEKKASSFTRDFSDGGE